MKPCAETAVSGVQESSLIPLLTGFPHFIYIFKRGAFPRLSLTLQKIFCTIIPDGGIINDMSKVWN